MEGELDGLVDGAIEGVPEGTCDGAPDGAADGPFVAGEAVGGATVRSGALLPPPEQLTHNVAAKERRMTKRRIGTISRFYGLHVDVWPGGSVSAEPLKRSCKYVKTICSL